jgi:K+-transporting ATPase ATPase C chain
MSFMRTLRQAAVLTLALLALAGALYPALLYGVGRLTMPWRTSGSLVRDAAGHVVGSVLIGQSFTNPAYFHGRPSAVAYDAAGSGASNLGPLNPDLADSVAFRAARFRDENALGPGTTLPADAVTASGSGLDPDISPETALLQGARVASARGANPTTVAALVIGHVTRPDLGVFGEPRVNVLRLNLALDSALGR